ncbi:CMP-N-acetylneuraminate-beta-galactosamide-alpha-2,3-sialyltransferase 1 isoform X3 [Oreochromis niloticus]|uniref:CMP-N-acetylneuraminate-beta-galactosamide- alpha-2,3-sialyltransferase 1 isoform X3 n=1 Tax=Oreochromis niloticus TaxID=8128 RepID=UPI0009058ED4|nr:CMP-N-acetylneuraminate-beta-galactosamide-alpha-2,3-sialyltransferase 1 isoform X3 [Oreochromis niloticus]
MTSFLIVSLTCVYSVCRFVMFPGHTSRMISKLKMLVLLLCFTGIGVYFKMGYHFTYYAMNQKPCGCKKCLSEDKQLLLDQSNRSIQPFLTPDFSISENEFNWWKRLQTESRSFGVYETTVANFFKIFPRNSDVIQPKPDHCRTCAVVGNSGNLRRSHYGPLIDLHEVVIRMNTGITRGFEKDIQDFEWLINASTTGFTGRSYMPVPSKIKANKDLVMVVNPAFMKYVHDVWLGHRGLYPSTGFMALILALHICDEVDVFGYGADSNGNWSHYWEILKNKNLKTGVHAGKYEYDIIWRLAQQQKIKFYEAVMKTI